jgi:flagellar motor switch protein FliM
VAEVSVRLTETSIAAAELADLRVGDIIATETDVNAPVLVSIDGVARFGGKPGVYQGRKAVRLTEAIENPPPKQQPGK